MHHRCQIVSMKSLSEFAGYFQLFFYICFVFKDPIIKRRVDIPFTGLILPHFYACPEPKPGFQLMSWPFTCSMICGKI